MHLKALCGPPLCNRRVLTKTLLIMKLTAILILVACLEVSAKGYSQITLSEKNAPLTKVFKEIQKQSGYDFVYTYELVEQAGNISVMLQNVTLQQALDECLRGKPLTYTISDNTVVIKIKNDNQEHVLTPQSNPPPGEVRGRIVDDNNEPLLGATVKVKGGNIATKTDAEGKFVLAGVNDNATLEISFVGFESQSIPLNRRTSLVLTLKRNDNPLDQVQVVAYGKQTGRLSVGNIGTVSSKTISMQNVTNPLLAIQGQVPGLYITQSTGIPGSGVVVRIQGQNSIGSGNDPLFVVDGVPYPAGNPSNGSLGNVNGILGHQTAANSYGSPLSYINPNDIESISVLKDADATAIYGSLAANGAIIITTKRGKAGDTKIDITVQQGRGKVPHFMPLMNTQEYLDMRYQALRNSGLTVGPNDDDLNGAWGDINRFTDWQKILLGGTSHYGDYNLSISGGTGNVQYLVGGTYHRETTVFPGSGADTKGAMHFSLDTRSANNRFKMQFTGSYQSDDNHLPTTTDLTPIALQLAPNAPALYKADGTLNWQVDSTTGASTWVNPLSNQYNPFRIRTNALVANSVLSYTILPGLDLKSSFGYNIYENNSYSAAGLKTIAPEYQIYGALERFATYYNSKVLTWIVEPQITYHHNMDKGTLDALIGSTIRQTDNQGDQEFAVGYNSDELLQDIHSATTVTVDGTTFSTYKYNALYGKLGYNWDNKYILSLGGRRDGSSRFGSNNQFHNFWSAGAAWVFTESTLLKNKLSWLSFGKLKLSYGTTGNDQIGDYQYLNLYSAYSVRVPYQGLTSFTSGALPNPNLQWELTKKLQGGVSLGFLHDRILLDAVYAYNRSSNELVPGSLPSITGASAIIENLPAIVQNTQWEVTLNTINIKTKDFRWNSSLNLTVPRNKLVSIPANSNLTAPLYVIGQPLAQTAVYHFLGVDPARGTYVVADSHGNPTSNPSSTDANTFINTVFPTYYGGLQNSFQYKGFGLDFMFRFVKKVAANYTFGPNNPGAAFVNEPIYALGAWQKPGDIAKIQRYDATGALNTPYSVARGSDAGYSDGSFIRMQYVSFSYTLPQAWLNRAHIKNIRLFAQGQNLFTITQFKGLDPETGNSSLPPLRVITIGLNLGL